MFTYIVTYKGPDFVSWFKELEERVSQYCTLDTYSIGEIHGVQCLVRNTDMKTYIYCQLRDTQGYPLQALCVDQFPYGVRKAIPSKGLRLRIHFQPYIKEITLTELNTGLQMLLLQCVPDANSRYWECPFTIKNSYLLQAMIGTCWYCYGLSYYDLQIFVSVGRNICIPLDEWIKNPNKKEETK